MEILICGLTFASMFIGGVFQSLTGFGAGIIILPALSSFLPILSISAISSVSSFFISGLMAWRFRDQIQWKKLLIPYPIFVGASYAAFVIGPILDPRVLGTIFGVFLLFLGTWSILSQKKGIRLSPHPAIGLPIVALCGVLSAWFNMSGPLLSLYFLAATREVKFHYVSTIQMFITLTCVFNNGSRIFMGILTTELIPYIVVAVTAVLLGQFSGVRILYRINVGFMKKVIHGSIIGIGIMEIVKNTIL